MGESPSKHTLFFYVRTLICKISYACQYIEVRRLSAIESGYWLLIQGALAVIRVTVWVWDPSWDDSHAIPENLFWARSTRQWKYDLTETRLVVLWGSLQTGSPAWLPSLLLPLPDQLSIPNWALPAFSPRNQNPEQMFELARTLSRITIDWDDSLQILQNAEKFWDMPPGLFMAWVFAWPNLDSSWVDGPGKSFSCRLIKEKQYEGGEQRLHFLPCWNESCCWSMPAEDGVKRLVWARVFGVPSNRNRCVFALDEDPDFDTNSGGALQNKFVVGCDTPISGLDSRAPAEILGEARVKTMLKTMDMMWKTLDAILKVVQIRPPTPSIPSFRTEPHSPTNTVRTSQQASPAGSAIELATLPCADEEIEPDADQTPPPTREQC